MIAGLSIWKLLIILGIIVVIFGTKKLRNLGGDLGGAVKGFKSAMDDDDKGPQKRVEHDDSSASNEHVHSTEQDDIRK